VTEAIAEARDLKKPIYLAVLDVQKAFDVVGHTSLLRKVYHHDQDPTLWALQAQNLKTTNRIKLQGHFGASFQVAQGVGQGKILSTHNYKTYVNDIIEGLTALDAGFHIGEVFMGLVYCADDVILISPSLLQLQAQLHGSQEGADKDHYIIHPHKTQSLAIGSTEKLELELDGKPVTQVKSFTHLGITRDVDDRGHLTLDDPIDSRVSLARRTGYALMGAGYHGANGLSPAITASMYNAFVSPRLLYGLETLVLCKKHLETYQKETLLRLQSLPPRTAKSGFYLLIGILPVEARLDTAIASILHKVTQTQNVTLQHLATQQLTQKDAASNSWFSYARNRLARYSIDAHDLLRGIYRMPAVKESIRTYWKDALCQDAIQKSSLRYLALDACSFGKPHPVWSSSQYSLQGTRHSYVKAKLLLGVYTLQANRTVFNQNAVDPTCLLCGEAPENRLHFILHCLHSSLSVLPYATILPDWSLASKGATPQRPNSSWCWTTETPN
jgi:hypothetical protein